MVGCEHVDLYKRDGYRIVFQSDEAKPTDKKHS
jgi:hypothetical protein